MTHLQEALTELKKTLTEMAQLVQSQIKKSVCSLMDKDEDLANEVVFNERRVNAMELTIDKECENIFALLAPVAHDMRLVFATLKINADLERIGDYAEGIAQLVLLGKKQFDFKLVEALNLKSMHEMSYKMLEDVSTAYCDDNTKLARSVFAKDLQLNEINKAATEIVINYCKSNIDKMNEALLLLSIIRKLERVGDHITNIAEEVIFYKEAKILKHGNKGQERP